MEPTRKDRFTALDTWALVRELRAIGPARVDKAYDLAEGGYSLQLRVPGSGRRELRFVPGRFAALLSQPTERSEELSPIARELRRLLTGAALRSVSEPGGERFLESVWARSTEPEEVTVAIELFGAGNLIVARGGRIALVTQARKWAHRELRVGATYARPPSRPDPWTLGRAEIEAELGRSRTDLASTLAARLGLGGPLAEEVIARGGWNAGEASAATVARVAPRLHDVLTGLLEEIGDRPKGYVVMDSGVPIDATPYRSRRWAEGPNLSVTELATFSEAATLYFATLLRPVATPEEAADARARSELERLAERQRGAIEELARAIASKKADADAIFANFGSAEAALEDAARRDPGPKEIEVELDGRRISLSSRQGTRENALSFYEEAKRLSEKLDGARAALRETEAHLAEPRRAPPAARLPRTGPRASKTPWFARFRWFVSSEGVVVIAGRDASSNDVVVRRHLKKGDAYVHADLHGAASVVVKRPERGPSFTDVTLGEAAQWAVAFSKAWRAGLASATAFWVNPDQVSKSAETGEFVARGAWVVRGTKNFVRDVPLELAVGTIVYEGEERWTAAPPSAVRSRGAVRALLTPGEERERSRVETELARDLGLSRSVLQSLLPAGGVTVRRP